MNIKVLILAGGLGTRLRAAVPDRPKPMAEAAGKPFLEYLIERLRRQGFTQIILCVGFGADQIQNYFGDGRRWGVRLNYALEKELLGTAGAIKNASQWIDGPFMVLNGDSYQEMDLPALVRFHKDRCRKDASTIATITARLMSDCSPFGSLAIENKKITGFREKGLSGPGWINAGVYLLEPDILGYIPENRAVSIEKQTFPSLLEQHLSLYAFQVSGFFVDIGTPSGYGIFKEYVEGKINDHPE